MDYEMRIMLDFIAENWAAFTAFCEERGDDPDEVYKQLGGED
ncbi:hypothetical protein JLBYU37_58 [Escherichia phage JLBYU37]|uniref:Uncharacterized protein n=3 Tax=Dhillonvirus TaxID=1623289 RepID=G9JXJ8_9CAUD|nr:hypothetical protein EP23p43 [Shigella phage EP23]YP_010740464.1 hypothetical protein P9599_gp58 [Escherichia phage JLBYU37]AEV89360.1 hypothetical protein EP23p43 [Shigella phage EP23]UGO56866.1 hypothetical protein JLBYU37_58 [Escherichia phage JLBYU37]